MTQTIDEVTGHEEPPAGHQRRWRRVLIWVVAVMLSAILAIVAAIAYLGVTTNNQIERIEHVFTPLATRPAAPTGAAAGAINILLLGTDTRSESATTGDGVKGWDAGSRSDTMMVLHVSADRRSAAVVSIPRDSWVDIPGHGTAKINAAYSLGGPTLAVETVENLTGIRLDHLAVVDWAGYKAMIDVLGGVNVNVPTTVYDHYRDKTWYAGKQRLNGADALLYARERSGLPGGDLDRVKRQQAVLRSLSNQALSAASNPITAYRMVSAFASHVSIDDTWGVKEAFSLLTSMRHLKSSDISYLSIPTAGTGMTEGQSVVWVDRDESASLWNAVREDEMGDWAAANEGALTPAVVR